MTTIQWTIINPEDNPHKLWRYLTYEKFEHLLNSSELYLRRLDKFKDQFEGKLDSFTEENIKHTFNEHSNSLDMQMQLNNILKSIRSTTFANCWHLNDNENLQMWEEYCGNKEGVAIVSNAKNLVSSILNHNLGPMHFQPITYGQRHLTDSDLRFPLELINFKDEKYQFENEYRVSLIYTKGDKSIEELKEFEELLIIPPETGVNLKIELDKLINEVVISPFANSDFREKIEELCKKKLKLKPIVSILK